MLIDFLKVKELVNDFIDSFDHTLVLQNLPEDKEIIDFAVKTFDRVIVLPFNSTAELQAKLFFDIISRLLPLGVNVAECIVHETTTGYAKY